MVELRPLKPRVKGSSPFRSTYALIAQLVEHGTFNAGVEGSSPSGRTNLR